MTNPTTPLSVAAAKAALSNIKRELSAALRDQADTTRLRVDLVAAQEALAAAEVAERAAAAQAQEAAANAEHVAVAIAQEATAATVAEAIRQIDVAPDLVELPEPIHPAVAQAAAALIRAESILAQAAEAVVPAEDECRRIAALLDERRSIEATIRQRRLNGDRRDTDAADLHLAAQDAADLEAMLAEAERAAAALRPNPTLRQDVEIARETLVRAQSKAILEGQLAHVRRLEAAFVAAVRQLGTTTMEHGVLNFSTFYSPSDDVRRIGYGGRL